MALAPTLQKHLDQNVTYEVITHDPTMSSTRTAQACHVLSKHIGSVPGVSGTSGKQTQPLAPARSCFMVSFGDIGQSMMVAALAIEAGAALMAFWIFHSDVPGAGPAAFASCLVAYRSSPRSTSKAAITRRSFTLTKRNSLG